jgi:hypothetical protein
MLRHFALNVAVATVVFAWGMATGRLLERVLPDLLGGQATCRS